MKKASISAPGSYQQNVSEKLHALLPVFARASIGDFSLDVDIHEEEDEFTELYAGVQVMLEVIREKISEFEALNSGLEKTVKEKTAALEEAQHLARLGNWEWNVRDGSFTLSDEMYRIFGLNRKNGRVAYSDYIRNVHPGDRAFVNAQLEKSYKTKKLFNFYYRCGNRKNKVKVLHCIGRVITDRKGYAIKLAGTMQDVTRLKMAERALQETNARLEEHVQKRTKELQKVVYNLNREIKAREKAQKKQDEYEEKLKNIAKFPAEDPNPILRFSIKDHKVLYANKPGKKLLSFFASAKTKKIKKEWRNLFSKICRSELVTKREMEIAGRFFMCTLVPVARKKYLNFYGDDITAFKEAESEIRKLSIIIAKTENAVMIANRQGKIQWVNEGFIRLSGYALEDVKGTRGEILRKGKQTGLHPENLFFRKMIKGKQPVSYESRNYKKDGAEYWTISTLTPVLNYRGEMENVVIVEADITLKKKVEQEMVKAKKIAEESSRAKELFLANMSHEIRTPMNAIMGVIQLMEDTKLDEKQKEYMRAINFAGENLMRIINDVLDLSKIESGKITFEKIDFNIHNLVKELVNSLSYRAQEKNIQLQCETDKNIPSSLLGDPVRVNQVLMNLLGNAIKFTEKGYVKLSIKLVENSEHRVRLRFDVEDTGIGIREDMYEHIFKPFEQANKGTARKYGGTGLGLSIVKRLTELQKGTVCVKSTLGAGSAFTVELPFSEGEKAGKKVSEKNYEGSCSIEGAKALLVEDNGLNLMVAEKFLEGFGLIVSTAENGLKAISKLNAENFDLILMDIQMPEMDGYEAAHFIRKNMGHSKKNIPILAMTAHAIRGEEEKCLQAGMDDYISKPLNRDVLRDKIKRLLTNKKKQNDQH